MRRRPRSTGRTSRLLPADLAVLLVMLLGACEPVSESNLEVRPASESTGSVEPAPPAAPATPEPRSAPPQAPDEPPQSAACDDETMAAIDRSIDGQLQAFRDGDFDAARTFASSGFRDQVDVTEFETLIENNFEELLSSTGHTLGHCLATDDRANVLVGVRSGDEVIAVLAYRLLREDGQWRVSGAANIDQQGSTPPPIRA